MYDSRQTKELQASTKAFLSGRENKTGPNEIAALRDVLRFHEYRYYVQNDTLISDFEYDTLYKRLEQFEKENPVTVTPDSPTQR